MALSVFLFTDIVGSSALWAAPPAEMTAALERHDQILSRAITDAGGSVFKHTGDGCAAVFPTASGAVVAAASAQGALAEVAWGELDELQVRMGVHAGDALPREGDWFGPALNRCARLMGIAHGGQVLVSEACHALLEVMPAGLGLRDLGMHRLRDLAQPEHVWQSTGSGLAEGLPAPHPQRPRTPSPPA